MAAAGWRLQRKVIRAAQDAQADFGLQQTLLVESIAGIETLKSVAGEGMMLGRWRRLAEIGSGSQQTLKRHRQLGGRPCRELPAGLQHRADRRRLLPVRQR
jgi:ATP-binding cassette subfamily C protein LapB